MADNHPATRAAPELVAKLLSARTRRVPLRAPSGLDLLSARQLQADHVAAMLHHFGGAVTGCKLGGTNQQALEKLGLDCHFPGPSLSHFSRTSPARMARADFQVCIVKAEFGVCFSADAGGGGGYPELEVLLDAIAEVFPAIEVADSRYADWAQADAGAIIADLGYAGAWVRCAPCRQWRELDLATLPVRLLADGADVRSGNGSAVLGDPLHALSLVIAELGRHGRELHAGDVVSTGTCTVPLILEGPAALEADFGPLGSVALELS